MRFPTGKYERNDLFSYPKMKESFCRMLYRSHRLIDVIFYRNLKDNH